jgi:hypothetical protein
MNTHAPEPRCFEFDFPRLDTAVEVETTSEGVVIRASRNTFSEERKRCFIRELVAEGFIDESCRWQSPGQPGGVRWMVDPTEFMPDVMRRAQTNRFMRRLIFSATGLWLCLMALLLLRPAR